MEKNTNKTISKENGLIIKWGNELFEDGITNAPKCLMRYSRRFVKATHFQLICTILSYQFGSDAPFPSRETIAADMGISVQRVAVLLRELEEDELIEIYWRYDERGKRTSNEYSFKPLLDKCLNFSKSLYKNKEKGIKRVKKRTKETECLPSSLSKQSVDVVNQQSVTLVIKQSVDVVNQQSVYTKKELEERNLEESNINNVCIDENQKKVVLTLIDQRQDLKKHTRKIINLLNIFSKDEKFNLDVFIKTLEIINVDVKGIGYLENALTNNIKKGYVNTYDKKNVKSSNRNTREDTLPKSIRENKPEEKTFNEKSAKEREQYLEDFLNTI